MKRRSTSRSPASLEASQSAAVITQILANYNPKDPATLEPTLERVEQIAKLPMLLMNRVQEQFVRCHNKSGRMPRTRLFEGANQSGKTTLGVAEDLAHAMGYR